MRKGRRHGDIEVPRGLGRRREEGQRRQTDGVAAAGMAQVKGWHVRGVMVGPIVWRFQSRGFQ